MTFEVKTFDELVTEMKINLVNNVDEITDLNVGSVIYTIINTFGNTMEGIYTDLNTVYDGSRITTSTGDDLEEIGLIVGITRDAGIKSTGYITLKTNLPLSSNVTIVKDSQVSTQPNTSETQLVYNVTADTIFQASVTGETNTYINGIYEYKLDQRFISSISSLKGTSSSVAYTFLENTDFEITSDYSDTIVDIDDYEAFNLCEAITDWTPSGGGIALTTDAVKYYEGTKSLKLSKTGTTYNYMTYTYDIGLGNEIDITDTSLLMRLFIKDAAALAKISEVTIYYASDSLFNNSIEHVYDVTDLTATEWNLLIADPDNSLTTSTGNVDTANIRYLKIKVELLLTSTTIASGDINMDNYIFSSYETYTGDIISWIRATGTLPDTSTTITTSYTPLSWEIPVTAALIGIAYNIGAGRIIYKISSFSQIASVYNYEAMTSGVDEEIDSTLRDRIENASDLANVATVSAIENNVKALTYVKTCNVIDLPEESMSEEIHVYNSTTKKFTLDRLVPLDDAVLAVYETHTLLDGAISAADVTISIDDANSFAATGTIQIGEELITYTGVSTNDLTGCTRGTSGTVAAIHLDDSIVSQYEYIKDTDYVLTSAFEIDFDGGISAPAGGTTLYVDYDIEKLGYFDVYVTGINGSLNASQITLIEDYIDDELKSAGILFTVSQPSYVEVETEATITYETDYDYATIGETIEDNITDYITDLDLGDDVLLAKITNEIMSVTGVSNVTLLKIGLEGGTLYSTDYTIDSDEKALPGTITLS